MSKPWVKRVRRPFEIGLVWLASTLIPVFPRGWIVALSRLLGRLAFVFSRRDRGIAMKNLDFIYGTALSGKEKEAIAVASFQTFALVILDLFWFARWTVSRIRRWVSMEPSLELMFKERAVVFVTAHMSNWEIMGQAMALRGYPMASVAKPLANPVIDDMLIHCRRKTGQQIIPREGAIRELLRFLQQGGGVGLLLDQNTLPSEGGVYVDFFGIPTPVSRAAASLSQRLNIPVVVGFCRHEEGGRYSGYVLPPLRAADGETPESFTGRVMKQMEDEIRKRPGHWLWMYRYWRYRLPDSDPKQFPDYAYVRS